MSEINTLEDELEIRFRKFSEHPDIVWLAYSHKIVSSKMVQSHSYRNCNGVALLNSEMVGLSHYDLNNEYPETYLREMIKELKEQTTGDISAVLIGGDRHHLEWNRRVLKDHEIPIIGEYCDRWMDEGVLSKNHVVGDKHVIVVPKTQEVLMYSDPVGYKILTP